MKGDVTLIWIWKILVVSEVVVEQDEEGKSLHRYLYHQGAQVPCEVEHWWVDVHHVEGHYNDKLWQKRNQEEDEKFDLLACLILKVSLEQLTPVEPDDQKDEYSCVKHDEQDLDAANDCCLTDHDYLNLFFVIKLRYLEADPYLQREQSRHEQNEKYLKESFDDPSVACAILNKICETSLS